jgi:hypothetical protein
LIIFHRKWGAAYYSLMVAAREGRPSQSWIPYKRPEETQREFLLDGVTFIVLFGSGLLAHFVHFSDGARLLVSTLRLLIVMALLVWMFIRRSRSAA